EGDRIIQVRRTAFSIGELFDSIHDMMAPMLVGRPVSLRFVPPEVDRRLGNAVALSRVLVNLITNAIKFTRQGEVEVRVRANGADSLEFAVWNPGPPLDPTTLGALTRPLSDDPLDHLYGRNGSGLGL